MKASLASALTIFALTVASQSAQAAPVATISGAYDDAVYDTPELIFNVPTGLTLQNSQMVLTGYQGLNNGNTATVSLGTLGAGSTYYNWTAGEPNVGPPGSLISYDYDDEYVNTASILPNSGATANCGGTCVNGGSPIYYADVGNFSVLFTANVFGNGFTGQIVSSLFSPTTNATGGFVSWEGLDANGYSEQPCCDIHSGEVTGDLANINLGLPSTPLPAALPLFASGLSALGLFGWRRKRKNAAALAAA
jgi:hypothetical protein